MKIVAIQGSTSANVRPATLLELAHFRLQAEATRAGLIAVLEVSFADSD